MTADIHGIWSFLSDNTVCGKPVEYKFRALPEDYKGEDKIMVNVALELEDITCSTCKSKLAIAHGS